MRGIDFVNMPLTSLRMALELGCIYFLLSPSGLRKIRRIPLIIIWPVLACFMAFFGAWLDDSYIYFTFLHTAIEVLFIFAVFKVNIKDAVFCGLFVFLVTYPLRQFFNLYHSATYGDLLPNTAKAIYSCIAVSALQTVIVILVYLLLKHYVYRQPMYKPTWLSLAFFNISAFPVLYLGNLGIWTNLGIENMSMGDAVAGILCSTSVLIAIIGYGNSRALSEKNEELVRMESMLQSQRKQYEIKKETVELLNRKYHDLKYHMLRLEKAENEAERHEYIRALDDELNAYASLQNTGNEALDIVMTEKGLDCKKKSIRLLMLLEGERINFLKPLDVTAIFGNALDNCIRAVENLSENRREITVRMIEREGWLILRFENEFEGELLRDEFGALTSTRGGESGYHGFGIKSIEFTVGKYDGHVSIETKNGRFVLNILIPQSLNNENL